MIEVENLTKKFGDLAAVKNLNFKVEKEKSGDFSDQMQQEKQQP